MKFFKPFLIACILLSTSCNVSSVKVINAWKAEEIHTLQNKNILVIARSQENKPRSAFEDQMVAYLRKAGYNAHPSYLKIPIINDKRKYTETEIEEIVSEIKSYGYNAIILTEIKDHQEQTKIIEEGGYYTGGSYTSLYPQYYGGFYGYYNHPYSHPTYQSYVPGKTSTKTINTYDLETVVFNLDLPRKKQLIGMITSSIKDPETVYLTAEEYANKIVKKLK